MAKQTTRTNMCLKDLSAEEKQERFKAQVKKSYEKHKEARKAYNREYYKKVREVYIKAMSEASAPTSILV